MIEKVFVINLPHRVDRREECVQEFSRINYSNYEFVEAVNWKNLDKSTLDDLINREYKFKTKDTLAKYALVACGLSHIKIYDHISSEYGAESDKFFIILEDDFHIENPEIFFSKVEEAINLKEDWRIIYLGGLRNTNGDKRNSYIPNFEKATSVWNTHAYIIKNDPIWFSAVKEVAERGYFADRGFRKIIRDRSYEAEKFLIMWPYQVLQRRSFSDINRVVR
jgi:GR25 family glycosyltransferase involved in LPS biosynthesis